MIVMAMAILAGSTVIALIVIGLATVGLLLLAREWLKERRRPEGGPAAAQEIQPGEDHGALVDEDVDNRLAKPEVPRRRAVLDPEMFAPDVTYDNTSEDVPETGYSGKDDNNSG